MKISAKKWLAVIIIGFLMVGCLALNPGSSYSLIGKIFYKVGGFLLFFPAFIALLLDIGIIKGKERIPLLRSDTKSAKIVFWCIVVLVGLTLFFSFSALSKIGKTQTSSQENITLPSSGQIEQQENQTETPESVSGNHNIESENSFNTVDTEPEALPTDNENDSGIILKENQTLFEIEPKEYNLGDLAFSFEKVLLTQNIFKSGSYSYNIELFATVHNTNDSDIVNFIGHGAGGQAGIYYGKEECKIGTRNEWGSENSDDGIPRDYIFRIAPDAEEKVCLTLNYISSDDINNMSELRMDLNFSAINTANSDDTNEMKISFNLVK